MGGLFLEPPGVENILASKKLRVYRIIWQGECIKIVKEQPAQVPFDRQTRLG
jgi:hypothetical protein